MASSGHALMVKMELTEVATKFEVLMCPYFFKEGHAFNGLSILYLYILYFPKKLDANFGVRLSIEAVVIYVINSLLI